MQTMRSIPLSEMNLDTDDVTVSDVIDTSCSVTSHILRAVTSYMSRAVTSHMHVRMDLDTDDVTGSDVIDTSCTVTSHFYVH